MEFVAGILNKSTDVVQLTSTSGDSPNTHDLCCSLEQRLRLVQQHMVQAPQKRCFNVIEQIYSTLDGTLDNLKDWLLLGAATNSTRVGGYDFTSIFFQVAVEIRKTDALIHVLNITDPFDTTSPTTRSEKVNRYIQFELYRNGHGRQTPKEGTEPQRQKWEKLNNTEYLGNIPEGRLWVDKSLGSILNVFAQKLQLATLDTCSRDTRWIHLACCAKSLISAKSSKEFIRILAEGRDSALLIQDYLTECEMELLDTVVRLPNSYQKGAYLVHHIPSLTIDGKRLDTPPRGSQSTSSYDTEEPGEFFTCDLGGEQSGMNMGLKFGSGDSIVLRLSRWPTSFLALRQIDLRTVHITPGYGPPENMYMCDIIARNDASPRHSPFSRTSHTNVSSTPPRLFFRHARHLHKFQALLTGYTVFRDYKDYIRIRVQKKGLFSNAPKQYFGRLQLWDRDRCQMPESMVSYLAASFTGFSNASRASIASNASAATMRVAQALPSTHLTIENGNPVFTNYRPLLPMLVLFIQPSTNDKVNQKVKAGDILAFAVRQNTVDTSLCKCKDELSDCPRCFLAKVIPIDLKAGRYTTPKHKDELEWVEIILKSKPVREALTRDLKELWGKYEERLKSSTRDSLAVNRGYI